MATDQTSSSTTTDQQYVKLEKDEAIAEKINSLANEDEDKHDKPEDAQDQATPLPKTEGDDVKAELAAAEIEKTDDDSPVASAEDSQKHDNVDDAQSPVEKEGDDEKVEPAVEVEKIDDSVPLEAVVADDLKDEKELIPDTQTINVAELVEETPQNLEIKSIETGEEKKPKTADIPEAETIENSVETTERSSNAAETIPLAEPEAEVVKQEEVLETTKEGEKIDPEPEPLATEVQEKTEKPEKESAEKSKEADQSSTIEIVELSAEASEKQSDATEEKTTAEIVKETNNDEVEPTETGKEPVVTEVETTETGKEKPVVVTEVQTTEREKAEPVVTEVQTTETITAEPVVTEVETTETGKEEPVVTKVETIETEKAEPVVTEVEATATVTANPVVTEVEATETEKEEPMVTEHVVTEVETTETEKAEPVVTEVETIETITAEPVITEVEENQKEPEKHLTEQQEEERPNTSVISEHSPETSDIIAVEEKTREPEIEAEVLKETNNYESRPTEIEKADPVVAEPDEIQSEPEKQSFKQQQEEEPKTVTPETVAEVQEKPVDTVEVHLPKDSDIEVVKETGNSESESLLVKDEKPELQSTEVEEKPREELQVVEKVGETSEDVKNEQEIDKSEEKIDKEEETITTVNTAQVSLNEETQATPANLVEPSPEVEKKVIEEDGQKESSFADVIEGESSKEVGGVTENLEQASVDQEANAVQQEETEHIVPTGVEEKVIAANDDKEPEAPNEIIKKEPEAAVQVSSRDVEVDEIKKTEAQNEAKTAKTEAESVQVKSAENDIPADDNKQEVVTDTKVGEISKAVSEPVRETLASKLQEKEEETTTTGVDNLENKQIEEPVKTEVEATDENDATKTSKDLPKETPAKPAQKQSNNIIAKVKQSLVKAKKAITGKSPSSKNLSSDAKGDIKVK